MGLTISDSDLLVIQVQDGAPVNYPLTYSNFRMLFPQTSFPDLPDNSFLVDFGYAVFKYTEQPAPVQFENTNDGPIVWDVAKDAYTNTWINTPFTPAEMEAAKQNALYSLRRIRDGKLQSCDYTQLPDVPLTTEKRAEWVTYRQQLRDYMDTVIDPFNPPAWPIPPKP
tara:strand:- start:7490 stop:7993 length:504 start_codon:yes stop_codon:yes gene_type:complete